MATRVKVATVTCEAGVFRFAFGPKDSPIETVTVDTNEFTAEVKLLAQYHGFEQKLRDSYAGSGGDPQVALGLFKKVKENLDAGQWRTARAKGDREDPIDLLAEAVHRASKALVEQGVLPEAPTAEQAKAGLEKMDKAQRDAIRRTPEVSVELAKVKAEKAKGGKSLADIWGANTDEAPTAA